MATLLANHVNSLSRGVLLTLSARQEMVDNSSANRGRQIVEIQFD